MKAAVRTDAAPTDTNSTPKTQTTQTPPSLETLPSRGYPPNTPLSCNPRPTLHLFLINHLPRPLTLLCDYCSTHLPSHPNTLHPSPSTLFPLPAHLPTPQ